MAKSKLSDEDILNICNEYITTNKNMSDLAKEYHCSSSLISKSFHKAVALGIIDVNKAQKIKVKASENTNNAMREKRL